MRLRKLLSSLALAGVLMSLLSGCDYNPPREPLAVIGAVGGHCAEGVCEKSFTIYDNGTTSDASMDFTVTPLVNAIAESKLRELSVDPEAFCQSYVDGNDLTIQVPAWGDEVYTVCQLKDGIKDPLAIVAQDMFYKLNREIT